MKFVKFVKFVLFGFMGSKADMNAIVNYIILCLYTKAIIEPSACLCCCCLLLFDCELLHYSLLLHISYERKFDIIHTFFIYLRTNVEKFRNCKQSCILYDYPISVRGIIFESGKSIS